MKSPIVIHDNVRRDLLPGLASEIIDRARAVASSPSLNQGGWKSGETLFEWEAAPNAAALRFALGEHVGADPKRHRLAGWAMINRAGSFHPAHHHQTAIQAGIYYVTPGDPFVPTIFELADGSEIGIDPIPGRLVLFPGNLWHRVPVYEGAEPRITIAFDVRRA